MVLRRDFLQLGAACSFGVLSPLPSFAAAPAAPPAPAQPLFRLLHDRRVPASLAVALNLGERLGLATSDVETRLQAVDGDVTHFWNAILAPAWRERPVALAGTTGSDVLFCLQQLARDHRLRLQWQEVTAVDGAQPMLSWLIAAA
jgi:hypothetical protein